MKRLNLKSLPLKVVFLFCVLTAKAYAQKNSYNEVSIASPTAASLGKYADIPVNNHTGIPQISIPIYTIKEGPLQLPISLSYHAGGLKVMEPASWVGAGWSLNAGGVITRTVQGAPDERMTSSVDNQDKGHFSNYGYNSYLYEGVDMNGKPLAYWQPFAEGRKDGEPDLFFFNFAGYSGKFFFRDDRTPVLVPEQDLKIESEYTGSGSVQSFTITTPDGIKYFFGKTASTTDVDPIEKTNPFTAQSGLSNGNVFSSWYLNKIVSSDGLFFISFTYTPENYSYYTLSMFPLTGDDMYTLTTTGNNYEYNLVKNIVNGVRLSGISFSTGSINFTATTTRVDLSNTVTSLTPESINTEAKSLDAIEINNNIGFCKKYVFTYTYFDDISTPLKGYFSSYNIQTDRKRLKLESLQEKSCDGTVLNPAHVFTYFSELVPRRLSFGQDHWGFYNGVTSNNSLIPTYTVNQTTTVTGANRDAGWPAMRGGALKKITYPTGGYSEFDFEANSTWISYSQLDLVYSFGISAGWGGDNTPFTSFQTFSGNQYKISFTNSTQGSQAYLDIYNSSNQLVKSWVAGTGETKEETLQLPAGNYKMVMQKPIAVSGSGASANFYEWTYSSIQKNETVGGLRIKTITQNDGISTQSIVTSYNYLDNTGKSTAILYSKPTYVQVIRNDMISQLGYWNPSTGYTPSCSFNGCAACDGSSILPFFKSPSSVRPMETTQGAHIGYSEVKVSQSGNGYSIYRYFGTNPWSFSNDDVAYRKINTTDCNSSIPNYPAAPLADDFRRGELSYEGHFTESGQLLKEAYYNPVYQTSTALSTPALIVATFQKGSTAQYLGTRYQLTTAKKTQTQTTEIVYQSGGGSITTTDTLFYQSPYHAQLTKKVSTSSKGETLESNIKYAADFRLASCDAIADCSQAYTNSCNTCLTQYNTTRSACGGNSSCLTNAYLDYQYCLTQARISFTNCRQSYNSSYSNCWQTAKNSADAELKPILELQGQNDFSPIEVTEWRGGKLLKANFNRFDYVSNPAGKVYLNKTQLISLVTPTTTFTNASVSGSTITKDSRYKDENLLKFSGGNLVELTKKDGVITTYIWGYGNYSYPVAKVSGASFSSVNSILNQSVLLNPSSDQALRDELNKLRVQLPIALVSTYTYSRLQGITSETDARGQTYFYEYDKLGRLLHVRDQNNNILKKYNYNYQSQ